jgi:serine/threonine-protein kinase
LSALDPVFAKALSKEPKDRFERCADFARALAHRMDAAPTGEAETTLAPAATPPRRSLLRAGVVVPAILAVLLIAAITVALMEFRRADRPEAPSTATVKPPTTTSPAFTPLPPPPPEPVQPPPTSVPEASPTTMATTPVAPPVAVIGANCSSVGSTATTAQGTTAYCSTLQPSGTTVWSLQPGTIQSPTVTTEPTDTPLPTEDESPIRMCMQQTGMNRLQCWDEIRRSNGRRLP